MLFLNFHRESPTKSTSLPVHTSQTDDTWISSEGHRKYLKAKYEEADLKLAKLEEELDVLIHCSNILREQRIDSAQGRMKYSKSLPIKRTLKDSDQFIDTYLALVKKSKDLDDAIAMLKKDCSDARNECSYIFAKYRDHLKENFEPFDNKQSLEEDVVSGTEGLAYAEQFMHLDDNGAMDKEAGVEHILDTRRTAVNVGTIVGGTGASIAFTTLFSATRGRLDLIAWAFTCFISVVFIAALYQTFQRPRSVTLKNMTHDTYVELRQILFVQVGLFMALPSIVGIGLLVSAVAFLDGSSTAPVPGSQIAISVAGYSMLGWLAASATSLYFGVNTWSVIFRGQPRTAVPTPTEDEPMQKMQKYYPSHILPLDHKWSYLPGGPEYFKYRIWRRNHVLYEKPR